jgi:hypothetical protein
MTTKKCWEDMYPNAKVSELSLDKMSGSKGHIRFQGTGNPLPMGGVMVRRLME